jgi:hypothetical protein
LGTVPAAGSSRKRKTGEDPETTPKAKKAKTAQVNAEAGPSRRASEKKQAEEESDEESEIAGVLRSMLRVMQHNAIRQRRHHSRMEGHMANITEKLQQIGEFKADSCLLYAEAERAMEEARRKEASENEPEEEGSGKGKETEGSGKEKEKER